QRVIALSRRHPELALVAPEAAASDDDLTLRDAARRCVTQVEQACEGLALHEALAAILELVAAANRYADAQEPWTLSRRARAAKSPVAGAELSAQLGHVLWQLCEALRVTAVLLWPFLPEAAGEILRRIGVSRAHARSLRNAHFGSQIGFEP